MNKLLRLFLFFVLIAVTVLTSVPYVHADELEDKIAELEKKVAQLKTQSQTLSGQISYYDSQIALNQLKISQTMELITSISSKIDLLERSIQQRARLLEKQIVVTYKQSRTDPFQMVFSSSDFSQVLSRFKYAQTIQSDNRQLMYDTQLIQSNASQQKNLIEQSRKKLNEQKNTLSLLRQEKDTLLKQTKNSETTYQKLLSQAIAERDAFRSFAHTKGGQLLPPQPSPDGWYYNQRDERWGLQCIGSTCNSGNPSRVWEVGCLITSVAMLQKKNGVDVNPRSIAANSSYFFQDLMLIPWPAQSGYKFSLYGGNRSDIIDSELSAGRPVVVKLAIRTTVGTHFIVLKSKVGSDYIMNDPWEGPDLTFSKYYSKSSIVSTATYKKI